MVSTITFSQKILSEYKESYCTFLLMHALLLYLAVHLCRSTHPLRVGILDIFGFENFEKNGFEQVSPQLIVYLHQHYFACSQFTFLHPDVHQHSQRAAATFLQ